MMRLLRRAWWLLVVQGFTAVLVGSFAIAFGTILIVVGYRLRRAAQEPDHADDALPHWAQMLTPLVRA